MTDNLKNSWQEGLSVQEIYVSPGMKISSTNKPRISRSKKVDLHKNANTKIHTAGHFSETQLLDIVDLPFANGDSYHFITGGDVDSLSYPQNSAETTESGLLPVLYVVHGLGRCIPV